MTSPLPVDFFSVLWTELASYADQPELDQENQLAWLRHQLSEGKASLAKLLDYPGPKPDEKRQLESPGFQLRPPRRQPEVIDATFVVEALFASTNLGISELYSAYLLSLAFQQVSVGQGGAEAVVSLFYGERQAKLRCLAWIFEQAAPRPGQASTAVHRELEQYAKTLLAEQEGGKTLIERLLASIDEQTAKVHDLVKRPNAPVPAPMVFGAPQASTSTAPNSTPAGFDEATQQQRINWHIAERERIASILFYAARAQLLAKSQIIALVKWLAVQVDESGSDVTLRHVLLAIMAALHDPLLQVARESDLPPRQRLLYNDHDFAKSVHAEVTKEWRLPGLRAAVLLQWTAFLAGARTVVPDLIKADRNLLDGPWQDAIRGHAFVFFRRDILAFQNRTQLYEDEDADRAALSPPPTGGAAPLTSSTSRKAEQPSPANRVTVAPWFRQEAIETVETLVISIAYRFRDRVKKLKLTQEDLPSLGGGSLSSRRAAATAAPAERRHDVEDLLLLIAAVYAHRPNAALVFWGEDAAQPWVAQKAYLFVKLVADARTQSMQAAYLDFLAAIAEGDEVATRAFDLLGSDRGTVSSGVSWSSLYQSLAYVRDEVNQGREPEKGVLVLLKSFLRLLGRVVASSELAKLLSAQSRFQPLVILIELAPLPLPVDFKAVLLDTVAAFCTDGQGAAKLANFVWQHLEDRRVLRTDAAGPVGGVQAELEEVEKLQQVYPMTVAFVNLLAALIRPESTPTAQAIEPESRAVPDQLGADHREPGVGPYVRFVVEGVLLPLSSNGLPFKADSERWRLTERALAFVERCLDALDFAPFMTSADGAAPAQSATILLAHPGFDMLVRILGQPTLIDLLLHVVTNGQSGSTVVDVLEKDRALLPAHGQAVLRALRILLRVFELQPPFLEFILPALFQPGAMRLSAERMSLLRGVHSLDLQLSWRRDVTASLAGLVEERGEPGTEDGDIALAAVSLVQQLSLSKHFDGSAPTATNLASAIQRSADENRIINAFRSHLDADVAAVDERAGLLRSAILNLLLVNTVAGRPSPNIAHLLLGYSPRTRREAVEVYDQTKGRYALHSIIDSLRLRGRDSDDIEDRAPLAQRDPALAQKVFTLLRQLCAHDYTASATQRFLRTNGDYFVAVADSMPFEVLPEVEDVDGALVYDDGKSVSTSAGVVVSTLLAQAAALDSIALEVNALAEEAGDQRLENLVRALFSAPDLSEPVDDMHWQVAARQQGADQSRARILEIFHALLFGWQEADTLASAPPQLDRLANLDYGSCVMVDDDGAEVFDFPTVLDLIRRARRDAAAQGALNTSEQKEAITIEAQRVVVALAAENNRRRIEHARVQSMRAWRNVLSTALVRAFRFVPVAERQPLLLELVAVMLATLGQAAASPEVAELLSATAVLLSRELRREALTALKDDVELDAASSATRFQTVVRSAVAAIVQPGSTPVTRGNLYAVLLNFVQHARELGQRDAVHPASSALTTRRTSASRGSAMADSLTSAASTVLVAALDRLLQSLCRDAIAGTDAWQTVAYTLLGALLQFAPGTKLPTRMVAELARRSYLQSFIESVRDARDLADLCAPDPPAASLNAKFVYEAKMSFLVKLAGGRDGAERLLDADALTILAQCDFLTVYDATEGVMDEDGGGYVSSALERRIELELPVLELAVAILGSVGPNNVAALRQASGFVDAHKETLLSALRRAASAPTRLKLQEAHLIAVLLRYVLPSVSDESLALPSSFGSLHRSVQALATGLLGGSDLVARIDPDNAAEREAASKSVREPRGTSNEFERQLARLADDVTGAVLGYLQTATEPSSTRRFRPVLSPVMRNEGPGRSPSLVDVIHFCQRTAEDLHHRLDDLNEVVAQLGDQRRHGTDAMQTSEEAIPPSELRDLHVRGQARILASLHLLEGALLLLWRHLTHALGANESTDKSGSPAKSAASNYGYRPLGSAASAAAAGVVADPDSLKREVQRAFGTVSSRLASISLGAQSLANAKEARSHEALLETLVRTIQDLVSL